MYCYSYGLWKSHSKGSRTILQILLLVAHLFHFLFTDVFFLLKWSISNATGQKIIFSMSRFVFWVLKVLFIKKIIHNNSRYCYCVGIKINVRIIKKWIHLGIRKCFGNSSVRMKKLPTKWTSSYCVEFRGHIFRYCSCSDQTNFLQASWGLFFLTVFIWYLYIVFSSPL